MRLLVKAPTRHTADITRVLVEAGVSVTGLRRAERQLEDVFFDLTTHGAAAGAVGHTTNSSDTQEVSHV